MLCKGDEKGNKGFWLWLKPYLGCPLGSARQPSQNISGMMLRMNLGHKLVEGNHEGLIAPRATEASAVRAL